MTHKCKTFHGFDHLSRYGEHQRLHGGRCLPSERSVARNRRCRSVQFDSSACGQHFRGDDHAQMRIALFEPDIPQNAGALIRLAACMDLAIDIIEPCGFLLSDNALRRAGMDYLEEAVIVRHASWNTFVSS